MTRVLVCGGRNYDDRTHIYQTLTRVHHERGPITCIIHGCATGADTEAESWTKMMRHGGWSIELVTMPANWLEHGYFAGGIRNRRMLAEGKPDLVVAFPGGIGTKNMKNQARAAGVEIIEVAPRERQ